MKPEQTDKFRTVEDRMQHLSKVPESDRDKGQKAEAEQTERSEEPADDTAEPSQQ